MKLTGDEAETGSLVAKNTVLNKLVQLDDEDALPQRIDCSVIFVLIGPIFIVLNYLNLIM